MQRQTTIANTTTVTRKWFIVDATDLPLGRMASEVALTLIGKNKPEFTPNVDCGDFIIVINAEKVGLSGNKLETKKYYSHSGHLGHLKIRTAGQLLKSRPEEMIEKAIWGMMPKGPLGRKMFKKLFVYAGPNHKHEAQQPEPYVLRYIGGNK